MNPFKRLSKPVWFLMLVTPLVIESCITAATPPSHWLNPALALLLIFAYGPPILFLRELWVRHALPLRSLFVFGLIYGIFNEGILAHTLTQVSTEPITHFIGYDEAFGVHWAWASLIVPWHAFYSVTFMILLTHLWFPDHASAPWLQKRGMRITCVLNLLMLLLYFVFDTEARPAPVHMFPAYLALMGLGFWGARRLKISDTKVMLPAKRTLILTALSGVLVPAFVTIAGFELAHHKVPLAAYFSFTLCVSGFIFLRLGKIHPLRLLAFMLGGTVGLCGFAILIARDPIYVVTVPLFLVFIFTSMKKVLRAAPL